MSRRWRQQRLRCLQSAPLLAKETVHDGRCTGDRRRQRRPVRRADGARGRRQRAAARSRAARMARRQLAAHAQPALHARRAAGRAGRGLPRRRVLAGPAEGDRRPDQRTPGAPGDPRLRRPAATGCAATACISSRRCPARCTWRAPTPSSWAAARRWSTPTSAAPRSSACRSATTRRWIASRSTDGRFVAACM